MVLTQLCTQKGVTTLYFLCSSRQSHNNYIIAAQHWTISGLSSIFSLFLAKSICSSWSSVKMTKAWTYLFYWTPSLNITNALKRKSAVTFTFQLTLWVWKIWKCLSKSKKYFTHKFPITHLLTFKIINIFWIGSVLRKHLVPWTDQYSFQRKDNNHNQHQICSKCTFLLQYN